MRSISFLLLGLWCAGTTADAAAQAHHPSATPLHPRLGNHRWPVTTGAAGAGDYFDQGLRLHWAFNHAEAIASFREAERRDSRCGMCAFGTALAFGPNINAAMSDADADSARAAIARARAAARHLPVREQQLIDALATRYLPADAPQPVRDSAWARAVTALAGQYPTDDEIAVLAADARMNLSPWNYWEADGAPRPGTDEVLADLDRVLDRNPEHPGACHLFIHAVEAVHPERGLPCAERLAELMPGAGHLVHMPGHIYIRVGRYADVVRLNQHAVHADEVMLEGPQTARRGLYPNGYYPHNYHFMAFAAAMMGNGAIAVEAAARAARELDPGIALANPWIEAVTPIYYWTLVTFGHWDRVLATPLPDPGLRFTTGMAYYARAVAFAALGRWAEARAAADSVGAIAGQAPEGENRLALEVAARAAAAEIALRRGEVHAAVQGFQAAVEVEDRMAYNEPPTWYYPIRHSLGKALIDARRWADAERVYREDLARFPDNGWSLFGLAQAVEGQGRAAEAAAVRDRFRQAWAEADVRLSGSRF